MVVVQLVCEGGVENGVSDGVGKVRVNEEEVVVPARRSSERVKKLMDQKEKKRVRFADMPDRESEKSKKQRAGLKRKINGVEETPVAKKAEKEADVVVNSVLCATNMKSELVNEVMCMRDGDVGGGGVCNVGNSFVRNGVTEGNEAGRSGVLVENGTEKSAYALAKETLRSFNKYYLHFIQEEEKRCQKVDPEASISKKAKQEEEKRCQKVDPKASKSKKAKKEKVTTKTESKSTAKRPDLKAITKMIETNSILFPEKQIGNIPGIYVGYQFFSRAEMVVVGFHSHWLNGIDYMGQAYSKVYKDYTFPLAVSIVMSGQYEDDLDNSEDVVYTGQGGNDLLGNKRQVKNQVLSRGNLALKNSCEQSLPVRVVRGHKCKNSYVGKVYTYDGLYKVVKYWPEEGLSGHTVYKYSLRRLDGQPTLTTNQVYYAHGGVPKALSDIRGLVSEDISGGQEQIPIPATNLVDDPPVPPSGFTYHKAMRVSKSVKIPSHKTGCNCRGACIDDQACACAKLNGSDFPYVLRVNNKFSCYRLIEAKDVIFECGPGCGCGPDCVNRASQRGMEYRLEVYRTPKKGWAVRSWDYIPSGAPVCEYIGVLKKTDELDYDHDNNYIFDIDCLQTIKGLDGREKRYGNVSNIQLDKIGDAKSDVPEPEFCIDAGTSGNVARFINHSCEPNLFVQCVLSSHHDVRLARIVLFAADNITPLQELTYDYGYALDSVVGPDGKPKRLNCYCGAAGCRKRLF